MRTTKQRENNYSRSISICPQGVAGRSPVSDSPALEFLQQEEEPGMSGFAGQEGVLSGDPDSL